MSPQAPDSNETNPGEGPIVRPSEGSAEESASDLQASTSRATEPRAPAGQGKRTAWWDIAIISLLFVMAANTALLAVGAGGIWLTLTKADLSAEVGVAKQAACLRFYEFVVAEARGGMESGDIQKLVNSAARGVPLRDRFDQTADGCGDVRSVLSQVTSGTSPK